MQDILFATAPTILEAAIKVLPFRMPMIVVSAVYTITENRIMILAQ